MSFSDGVVEYNFKIQNLPLFMVSFDDNGEFKKKVRLIKLVYIPNSLIDL